MHDSITYAIMHLLCYYIDKEQTKTLSCIILPYRKKGTITFPNSNLKQRKFKLAHFK